MEQASSGKVDKETLIDEKAAPCMGRLTLAIQNLWKTRCPEAKEMGRSRWPKVALAEGRDLCPIGRDQGLRARQGLVVGVCWEHTLIRTGVDEEVCF